MANRRYYQFRYSLERSVVDLYLHATFGAAGAVTIDPAQSAGIESIVHDGAGTYTISLQDTYNRILNLSHVQFAGSSPASPDMRLYSNNVSSATDPRFAVVFSSAGVDTNPASGQELFMQITLKNSGN